MSDGQLAPGSFFVNMGLLMPNPIQQNKNQIEVQKDLPWSVLVLDDPVNLMDYVTMVLKRVFGYDEQRANALMMEVHTRGRSVVWTGAREKAEFYVQQLHSWQLKSTMEKAS